MNIAVAWSILKIKELEHTYAEANGNAYVYATSGPNMYSCVIDLSSEDGQDWLDNYKNQATSLV